MLQTSSGNDTMPARNPDPLCPMFSLLPMITVNMLLKSRAAPGSRACRAPHAPTPVHAAPKAHWPTRRDPDELAQNESVAVNWPNSPCLSGARHRRILDSFRRTSDSKGLHEARCSVSLQHRALRSGQPCEPRRGLLEAFRPPRRLGTSGCVAVGLAS